MFKKSCETVNPLISVALLWTSERNTWSFGHPILMAAHESTTAKFSLITYNRWCTAPQKGPGYSFSLQPSQVHVPRPPTRCHSQCCPFQTAYSTPFALGPQHGTPAPPLPVICVRLMMMSRMNSMLFSTAHTPIQYLFAGDMSPYSQRQEHKMFLLFCTRTTTNSINFYINFL